MCQESYQDKALLHSPGTLFLRATSVSLDCLACDNSRSEFVSIINIFDSLFVILLQDQGLQMQTLEKRKENGGFDGINNY